MNAYLKPNAAEEAVKDVVEEDKTDIAALARKEVPGTEDDVNATKEVFATVVEDVAAVAEKDDAKAIRK